MSRRYSTRPAFTMIELLVVILIITVLAALLLPAVGKVRLAAKRAAAITEMSQLSDAIGAFKAKYRVRFVPSSIVLRENMDYTTADQTSLAYLKQVWPQLPLPTPTTPVWIDWNGDGVQPPAGTAYTLEGDQCLVFFLGGIVAKGGGFSSNPQNPAAANLGAAFYAFPANRLAANGNPASGAGFVSFVDPFGSPYAYFSSYAQKTFPPTDSGTYPNGTAPWRGYTWIWTGPGQYVSDCPTVTGQNFGPYADSAKSWVQPTGFQVVSAGYNKVFGAGGQFPALGYDQESADGDNLTSFNAGQLSGR